MVQITGTQCSRKSGPRRFLVGNSAFLNFNELPILRKDDMTLVDPNAKAAAMRGVKGSDKFGRQKAAVASGGDVLTPTKTTADADDDEDESQHGEDEDEDPLLVQEKKEKAEKSEATSEASANAGTPASEPSVSAKASPASASAGTPATETDASLTALLKQ